MHMNDHMEGFDKEKSFGIILNEISKYCPVIRLGIVESAIATIAPDFVAGLHESRPCIRKLRYIGVTWCPEIMQPTDDEFFKLGQIYESSTFNGGTYTFEEYVDENGERPIGSAHFEWVKEDMDMTAQQAPVGAGEDGCADPGRLGAGAARSGGTQ